MTVSRDPEGIETDTLHEFVDFGGRRVLEVGCGDGRLTWRYADAARRVVGVDPDADSLYFAPRECPPDLRDVVAFALAGAEALPFPPATFDAVILAWSL